MAALSKRSAVTAASQTLPWRFPPRQTFDPDTNPSGIISLATAENRLVTPELEAVANKVTFEPDQFHYSYSFAGGTRFPVALAAHLNECMKPYDPIVASDIQVTGSATPLHSMLAWALADPGDGIMTSRPVYGRFELDFRNAAQVAVVYADTEAEECFEVGVVEKFEEALRKSAEEGVNVKALLIVNPHNPLGKCYPRETLIAIMQFCQRHHIHLISDEIYACSVFPSNDPDARPFASALSINRGGIIDHDLLHVTYGLSKDFGAAGLRIGAIITSNVALRHAIYGIMRFHNPSGVSLAISSAMLEDRTWCRSFTASTQEKLANAHQHVTQGLCDIGVGFLAGSNAGFFVWVDLSPYLPTELGGESNSEFALAKKLLDAGIFLHPREEHALRPGWFRLVYTQDARTVSEGLRRIKSVIS